MLEQELVSGRIRTNMIWNFLKMIVAQGNNRLSYRTMVSYDTGEGIRFVDLAGFPRFPNAVVDLYKFEPKITNFGRILYEIKSQVKDFSQHLYDVEGFDYPVILRLVLVPLDTEHNRQIIKQNQWALDSLAVIEDEQRFRVVKHRMVVEFFQTDVSWEKFLSG